MIEHYGGRWLTAEFEMGDALIFGMYTMHGSLNNGTNAVPHQLRHALSTR